MKKLIIALGFIAPSVLFGQLDRSVAPKPAKAKEISIADPIVFKANNGLTVIVSENHKIPRVSFNLTIGSAQRMYGAKAGLDNIAGELILTGTKNQSKDQIDNRIDYIGARMNAGARSISLTTLTKHMEEGLSIFNDVLLNANFPQSEFDRIIEQTKSSLMTIKSNPEAMGENALMSALFAGHPYGEIPTEETIAKITREDVENYFKQTFVPEGSYLVIVGDITKEKAEELVNKYFAAWSGKATPDVQYPSAKHLKGNRVIFVKKPGAVQSYVQVAFPLDLKVGAPDHIPFNVTNSIFGGNGFGTRLMQNLREDKAYTYGAYSSVEVEAQGAYLSANGNFRTDVTDSAIVQLLLELDKMANSNVTAKELELTKSTMAGGFARSLEHASTTARFALNIERYGLDKNYYKDYLKKLEAVDIDKVLEMSQKYLTAKNCYIIVVGNESILEKLKQFDSDGVIEIVDAFGNPVKETVKATISAEELFTKYTQALTGMTPGKKLDKVLKKIKSVKTTTDMTAAQIPVPLKSVSFWAAPNAEVSTLEAQGMVIQKQYFDGKTGYQSSMQGKKEMTAEEIAAKQKSTGLIPELNYKAQGMQYELIGIENHNGTDYYVVKLNDGQNEIYDYYTTTDYMKAKRMVIATTDEGTIDIVTTYGDYKTVNGIKMPYQTSLSVGEMQFNGKVSEILINKGSLADFK